MDKKPLITLRITMTVAIMCSVTSAAFSWTYMERGSAIAINIISAFTVAAYVVLWNRLEKLHKEMEELQREIDRLASEILASLRSGR